MASSSSSASAVLTSSPDRDSIARQAETSLRRIKFLQDPEHKEIVRFLALKAACTEVQTPNYNEDGGPPAALESQQGGSSLRPWISPSPVLDREWHELIINTMRWRQISDVLIKMGRPHGLDTEVHYDPATAKHPTTLIETRRRRAMDLYRQVFGEAPPSSKWGIQKLQLWPSTPAAGSGAASSSVASNEKPKSAVGSSPASESEESIQDEGADEDEIEGKHDDEDEDEDEDEDQDADTDVDSKTDGDDGDDVPAGPMIKVDARRNPPARARPRPSSAPSEIYVQLPSRKRIAIQVDSGTTVGEVKRAISTKCGTPVEKQRLLHSLTFLWLDNRSLDRCCIGEGDVLELKSSRGTVPVQVKSAGRATMTFDVHLSDLTNWLKERIENQTGIPKVQQRLIFAGQQFARCRHLSSYNVKEGSTIDLVVLDSGFDGLERQLGLGLPLTAGAYSTEPTGTVDQAQIQ